ncbi:hypothetical protein HWV62_7962 [Athelia sp. TMB]|nr:hypothetical protein HWV62_7962 [Athelia sp. TMB]
MITRGKRTRTDSSESDGNGPLKKVARFEDAGASSSSGHAATVRSIKHVFGSDYKASQGSTFNAIGISGTATMVAGHFINGDYNVVHDGGVQDRVKGIQDSQKSSQFLSFEGLAPFMLMLIVERDINTWMAAPDTSLNYKAAREKHQLGTGSWLLDSPDFKRWKDDPDFVLWLRGGPGCGKTILCSSSIENIKNSCRGKPSVGYAYFFFDGTSEQSKLASHESFVRSTIMQLSDQVDGIPPALGELYDNEHHGRSQPLLTSLEDTLLRILQSFCGAYIVIDALDECGERLKVLKWIRSVTSRTSGLLHLMVTSRPEPDIKNRLRSLPNLLEIDTADGRASDDIRRYIEVCLSEVDDWTESQKELVRIALINGAAGVFRWVALMIHELLSDHCLNTSELQNRLRSLPKDLNEVYTKIIQRSTRRADVIRFLQWIIFGKRDFTARKLAEVASINFDTSPDTLPFYDTNRRYESPDHVLRACSGLVIEVKPTIQISPTTYIRCNESISHRAIAQTCLAYLFQFCGLESVTTTNLASFPLALYAARQCASHITSIRGEDMDSTQKEFILQLALPSTNCVLANWSRSYGTIDLDDTTIKHQNFAPSLYYASTLGLTPLVGKLIDNGADLNELGGKWDTALQAASHENHLEITRLLLEKGADVNASGGEYGTALQAASYRGHLEIVRLLLEKGADVNAARGTYGTALQVASYRGNLEIALLLVEKGADINATGGMFGTALYAASCWGQLDIVRLLLEKGADINATGGQYGTALQAASYEGYLEIARLLLEKGADINAAGEKYGTALQAASRGGHLEIARLLLEKGADINATGGAYGTALQAASRGGQLEIARLLLEKGADVNATGGAYGTALQVASYRGNLEIALLLLEKGTDVNATGGVYGTALQAVSLWGHLEIAQLLLEKGADINATGGKYGTALQAASYMGHLEIARLLLENEADANLRGGEYGTALQAAAYTERFEIVKLLLEKGAEVNAWGGKCGSALQAARATWRGKQVEAIVQLLKEHGALEMEPDVE